MEVIHMEAPRMTSGEPPRESVAASNSPDLSFWGVLLGVNGWVIGLVCYAAAVGELGSVWRVALGGMILSTGAGLLLLSPAVRPGSGDWVGRLLITLSLLFTLYTHWAAPQLETISRLSHLNDEYGVSDLIILSMGLFGIVTVMIARSRHRAIVWLRRRLTHVEDVI
jgi:hypothetical protein